MKTSKVKIKSIDDYINQFPDEIKSKLETIRATIKKAAPKATDVISYGMPAFKLNRVLVYFAVNKNHIGFYLTASPIKIFAKNLNLTKHQKVRLSFHLIKNSFNS